MRPPWKWNIARWFRRVFGIKGTPKPPVPQPPKPEPPAPPPVQEPEPSPLPRLRVRGHCFELETGEHWTAIQCSDFNLLNRWQHGEDVTPVLEQRADCGFNLLRVWTLYDLVAANIGKFLDLDYGRIPDFLDLCARHWLRVEFTAYTSTERPDHWDRLCDAVRGCPNVLLELVNEGDDARNRIDLSRYQRPSGVLASHGSGSSEAEPIDPFWDYATFHTNGSFEEQRKVGHNAMELSRGPVLTNETSRYPDVGMWRGKNLEQQRALARDAAAGAALLCAGSCFHSAAGKSSVLFDANTEAVARAWVEGAKSVNLRAQDGLYYHRKDLETADLLRVYERRGMDFSEVVRIAR